MRGAATAMVAVVALISASGCSMMGKAPADDPASRLLENNDTSAETIAAAVTWARNQAQANPREPYWNFRLGEIYVAIDSTARAVSVLQRSLEISPVYAPSLALLSKVYYDAGIHEDAIELLQGYMAQAPEPVDALRAALALHLEALGEIDMANTQLDACAPDSRDANAARAFVLLRGEDLRVAMESARRALESDSKSAANHNNYGLALLGAGKPEDARKAFRKALKIDPNLPGALYNMAIVETFYFFNESAGREWFTRYKQYASDDPDDLASLLDTDVTRLIETGDED